MRRFIPPVLALGSIILAIWAFSFIRAYEVAVEAAQYAPAPSTPALVHAGTDIPAVVRHPIAESAATGSGVTATVTGPVVVAGRVVIPAGSELKGKLEEVTFTKSGAEARMNFDVVLFRGQSHLIHTQSLGLRMPVRSDINIMSDALGALTRASIGAATGAAAGETRIIDLAMMQGAAVSSSEEMAIPITVTISQDCRL